MKTVKDILNEKGKDVWHISPNTKVFDALRLMSEKNVGALLVIDSGKLQGIFSERDYARKVVLEGLSSKDLEVKRIMSSDVQIVTPESNSEECMELMINKKIRHLPVYDNDKLMGIISIGDIVKAVLDATNREIN